MKKNLFYISSFLFCHFIGYSQNPNIYNQKKHGGTSDDDFWRMLPTPDNSGYILFGESNSGISGTKTEVNRGMTDLWISKVDLNLEPVWDKTYGGSNEDLLFAGLIVDNKIYVRSSSNSNISGDKTMNSFGDFDAWLLCLDLNGNLLWQNQYGGNLDDYGGDMVLLQNGNLLIATSSRSPISGNKSEPNFLHNDIWLIEISASDGSIIQQKVIKSDGAEKMIRVVQSSLNQNIYVSCLIELGTAIGDRTDIGFGGDDIWIVKVDVDLNVLQDKCFGGTYSEGNPLLYEIDDAIYLSCYSNSVPSGNKTAPLHGLDGSPGDSWFIKMDTNMNIIWDRSYGGYDQEGQGRVFKNQNGKLVFSCSSRSIISGNKTAPKYGNSDSWLLILNDDGTILTQESYGGTADDYGFAYQAINSSNELILAGGSNSPISGNITVQSFGQSDIWLAKLDASDFLNTTELSMASGNISVYPNPFKDLLNFKFSNLTENVVLSLFTADGKLLEEKSFLKGTTLYQHQFSVGGSIIYYEIQGQTVNHRGKLIGL